MKICMPVTVTTLLESLTATSQSYAHTFFLLVSLHPASCICVSLSRQAFQASLPLLLYTWIKKSLTLSSPERCEAVVHSCVDPPPMVLPLFHGETRMLRSETTIGFVMYLDACFLSVMVPVRPLLLHPCLADCLLDLPLVLLEHVLHVPTRRHQRPRVVDPLVLRSESLKDQCSRCDQPLPETVVSRMALLEAE